MCEQQISTFAKTNAIEIKKLEESAKNKDDALTKLSAVIKQKEDYIQRLQKSSEGRNSNSVVTSSPPAVILPVIIFSYNRPEYLKRTLDTILKYLPSENFPIIVSQDGDHREVAEMARSYPQVIHIQNNPRPVPKKDRPSDKESYYYISQHYNFGLKTVFEKMKYEAVIILEDDLEIAPDFFSYFSALYPVLKNDPTLFCVSAWNDNGQEKFVKDPNVLYRSNFFPGLGWMMTKEVWKEFGPKWPKGFWDDWMREPAQRRDRDCIRPEVSRTYTFGAQGSSEGQFYGKYLIGIRLNSENIDWSSKSLDYLKPEQYEKDFDALVASAIEIPNKNAIGQHKDSVLKLYYRTESEFSQLADQFGLMNDFKAGVPRTSYKGTVIFRQDSNRVLITPRK